MAKSLIVSATERLGLLRRLDGRHAWSSPDERRLCLGCGKLIRGWEILVQRSVRGLGPLRLRCPSDNCVAGPLNWVMPGNAGAAEITHASYANHHGAVAAEAA
jgi:hypothetical protein